MPFLFVDNARFPLFLILVLAAVGGAAIVGLIMAHKRQQALRELAVSKGMKFARHDPFQLPNVFGQTKLCSVGRSRKARNVIFGPCSEGDLRYFDYKYTIRSGKHSHTYRFGACGVQTDCHFKPMIVRREGLFDKVAGFFGFDDVDLDHGEFNRRFYVHCEDKKFAYDVLTQRAMQFFLDRRWLSMEIRWNYILFYRQGTPKVHDVSRLLDDAQTFVKMLPDYFKDDRAMRQQRGPDSRRHQVPSSRREGVRFEGIEPERREKRS